MDPETKSRVSGVNNNNKAQGAAGGKNEKFVKTMKKLPDVKMGHLEGKLDKRGLRWRWWSRCRKNGRK